MPSAQGQGKNSPRSSQGDLPEPPSNLAGESTSSSGRHSITVSNARGYLCRITTTGQYDCPPALIFGLFTNPNNTGVFRDIKAVTSRKVLEERVEGNGSFKVVEVEQLGEVRILFKPVQFRTLLKVTEDSRDAENLKTCFELIRSDVMGKFNGSWYLQPIRQEGSGDVLGTVLKLEQDVTPRGVPSFLQHMPVLGHVLRGICVRAVKRLLEDISAAVAKVQAGQAWEEVIKPAPAPLLSHALNDLDLSDGDTGSPVVQSAEGKSGLSEAQDSPLDSESGQQKQQVTTPAAQDSGQQAAQPDRIADKSKQADTGFWDAQSWLRE